LKKKLSPTLVIFLTIFIDLVGFGIIIPLSPYLSRVYGASPAKIGGLMAVYSLMQFIFAPLWGRLSDRLGRRPIMLVSIFGGLVSYLGFAFATSFSGLFFARMFAGICGANVSTAMAYIADISSEKDRSKSMGLIGAAFGLGFIFGPIIGGFAGEIGGKIGSMPPWGMNFGALVAAAISLINFLLALRILEESLPPEKRIAAISNVRPSRLKMLFRHIHTPTVGPLILLFFMSGLAMAHMESNLFIYVFDVFKWSQMKANVGFAYVGVVMVLTQGYLIRKLLPKFGERNLLPRGIFLMAIGFAGIGFAHSTAMMAVVMTALALGNGFTNPSILGSISLLTDSREQGEVMGVTQSLASLARILGPPLGGYFYQTFTPAAPFWVAGGISALGLLLVITIRGKIPVSGRRENP
jgi:MFS transporter, DHA1 family, tetracycline resistance protein